jgi:hypothetical protein
MGVDKGILHAMLDKGEDEEKYKNKAKEGSDLMFPVTIGEATHRPDIGVRYHSTIKLFDRQKDDQSKVHDRARQLNLVPPNPNETHIEPTTLQGRDGNTMHVLRLHGPHADRLKEYHQQHLKGIGEEMQNFHPHVTVDKDTWDRVKNSGAKTAKEAGIQFHPAELRHGDRVIATYPHKEEKSEPLDKGLKHIATGLGVASALVGASPRMAEPAVAPRTPTSISHAPKASAYNHKKMLDTIEQVESAGGKLKNHKPTSQGTAYGKYALMPDTIRETIHMHPDLRAKYAKGMKLQGKDLHNYMQDNPGLEDAIADKHLQRLEHHFGQDPNKVGFAWNQGIRGTYHAKPEKITKHPYTQKINSIYSKAK